LFKAQAAAPSDLAQLDFFEKKIRPVLAGSCYECHSAESKKLKGGLMLDTREGLLAGGDSGAGIIPGNVQKSLLITTIRHEHKDPDMAMPPKKDKLSEAVIADFEAWVAMGAPDPRSGTGAAKAAAWDAAKAADHWAFKKITAPAVPKPADKQGFVKNPIDSFVLETLSKNKLQPTAKADKHTLLRRVTYDLTGLPPTSQEMEAFLADNTPNAFEKVVDRLLASPAYGERWARHWLDIARYADTSGDRKIGRLRTPLYSYAWTYRDYVIKAFNNDLPYDQFIIEQIAADRLPESANDKTRLAALGFLTVGKRFMGNENDLLDDRIDLVTKGVMGLTGACARCHDHKFDPIPTKDYYSLHGIFASSEEPAVGPDLAEPTANPSYPDYLAEVAKIEQELKDYERAEAARLAAGMMERAGDYLLTALEASKTTDTSKKGGNFRLAARNKGLKAEVAAVWADQIRELETAKKTLKDPILGPWFTLASLPADAFEQKAPELIAAMGATPEFNPTIVAAIANKAPTSLADVAAAYTGAFEGLRATMGLPEFQGRAAKGGFHFAKTQAHLQDEALEALRKDAFASNSCMRPDERTIARTLGVQFTNQQAIIRGKFASLELSHPGAPIRAMALVDKTKPRDSAVLIRGEPNNKGPVVPRRFLTVLGGDDSKPFTEGSGRLELAKAIANRENPLTARVIVNRAWQWHFGQGIVRTISDFGTRSEPPTHPELLDWMATWFMEHNWSIKQLNKLIVMSATYQQDSRPNDAAMAVDPTNQWLWRANVQRLDFEQVRDTLLTISDRLETSEVGGRPFQLLDAPTMQPKARYVGLEAGVLKGTPNRRAMYAMIDRAAMPEIFNTFDFANPDISTGERVLTTVPQQALFMMNSPFVAEQVKLIFARKDFPKTGTLEDKVGFLFQTTLQRRPTPSEMDSARGFFAGIPESVVETNGLISPQAGSSGLKKEKAQAENRPLNPWERYAQVLMLTNELMYLR
jgi:cytochrome c553